MKFLFVFTDRSSFSLETTGLTKKAIHARITAFQKLCLDMEVDHKAFASSGTKFKLPISKPSFVGLEDDNGIRPIVDLKGNTAKLKGYSILSKIFDHNHTYTGKDGDEKTRKVFRLEVNPRFADFLTNTITKQLERTAKVALDFGKDIDSELAAIAEKAEAAKEARQLRLNAGE